MADGVQTLEKRLQRLELLLHAEGAPTLVTKLDKTGEPGALEAQFDAVAREHGFEDHVQMAEVANTRFAGISLPYTEGRRVGITSEAEVKAFKEHNWVPYGRNRKPNGEEITGATNKESVAPNASQIDATRAGSAFVDEVSGTSE